LGRLSKFTEAVIMALRVIAVKSVVNGHCVRAAFRIIHLAIIKISIKEPAFC
jgi:hypothetical protein